MESYTISKNTQFNSIEINFTAKPSEAIREALKALRFRWHGVRKVWYGYTTEEAARKAIESAENGAKTTGTIKAAKASTKTTSAPKANKYGVRVGDIFSSSWGYEQTNVDFFQVVALVGESSVRVREVCPTMTNETGISSMSADREYKITRDILPAADRSVFIKDQEHGDLKRLKSYAADGKSNPQFNLDTFANAYLCSDKTIKTYESWYY